MSTLHRTETVFKGGMAFDTNINGHTIRLDTIPASGGLNSGPSPKPLLLSALAGCTGMDIVFLLNKMHVPFDELSIETQAVLSDGHPSVYISCTLLYKIKLANQNIRYREKMEKAVQLSKEKYCGVNAMLTKAFPIFFEIVYL
ncbi:MAG: OsmC family protein [Bacteroidota bacterium]|jgi:putative redox protein|nr:OsmC family protein [Sphingobacteriales bacterium]